MNFLNTLAGVGRNMEAMKQQRAQDAMQAIALQKARSEAQARKVAGDVFRGIDMGGGAPVPVAMPGASPMPTVPAGGMTPIPPASRAFNVSAAGAPGAMPAAPAPAAAPAMGAPAGGLTLQQLAQAIKKQAPDAPGDVVMGVIEQYMPMLSQQSKMDFQMMKLMFDNDKLTRTLESRENIANMNNDTRRDISSASNETRRDISSASNETRRAISDASNATRRATASSKLSAQDQTMFRQLDSQYRQAEQNYRSLIASMAPREQIDEARRIRDAAQQRYQSFKPSGATSAAGPVAGTRENPLEPTSQEEIDSAPAGTYFMIDGQLMQK